MSDTEKLLELKKAIAEKMPLHDARLLYILKFNRVEELMLIDASQSVAEDQDFVSRRAHAARLINEIKQTRNMSMAGNILQELITIHIETQHNDATDLIGIAQNYLDNKLSEQEFEELNGVVGNSSVLQTALKNTLNTLL